MPISEVNEVLGIALPAEKYHTLGGMVLTHLKRIPSKDDYLIQSGYRFTVVEASERTIIKLSVERI